jgi:hypothetical protein
MNRQDLSKPPQDAELTERVIADTLAHLPVGSDAALSELLPAISSQLPCSVARARVVEALVRQAGAEGRAILFDCLG